MAMSIIYNVCIPGSDVAQILRTHGMILNRRTMSLDLVNELLYTREIFVVVKNDDAARHDKLREVLVIFLYLLVVMIPVDEENSNRIIPIGGDIVRTAADNLHNFPAIRTFEIVCKIFQEIGT